MNAMSHGMKLVVTIPGPRLGEVMEKLETIVHANRELEKCHQPRRASV